jgi:hypothetical protein
MLAVSATRVVVNAANTSGTKRVQAKKKVGGKVRVSARVSYPGFDRSVARSFVSVSERERKGGLVSRSIASTDRSIGRRVDG